jgi:hypothetical protein
MNGFCYVSGRFKLYIWVLESEALPYYKRKMQIMLTKGYVFENKVLKSEHNEKTGNGGNYVLNENLCVLHSSSNFVR